MPITTRGVPTAGGVQTTVSSEASTVSSSSTVMGGAGGVTVKTEPGLEPNAATTTRLTLGGLLTVSSPRDTITTTTSSLGGVTLAGTALGNALTSTVGAATTTSSTTDTDRPFKCELCNSTFTRLGNYTRHKKIHSLPSKVSTS